MIKAVFGLVWDCLVIFSKSKLDGMVQEKFVSVETSNDDARIKFVKVFFITYFWGYFFIKLVGVFFIFQ